VLVADRTGGVTVGSIIRMSEPERKTAKLTKIGIALTVGVPFAMLAFLGVVQCIGAGDGTLLGMEPNEWGDYVAGGCALIAAAWLVIGYFQQNEELRLTEQALRMQAEELRNQVEETRHLVQSSLRQAAASEVMAQNEHARLAARFVVADNAWHSERQELTLVVENEGWETTLLSVHSDIADTTLEYDTGAMPLHMTNERIVLRLKGPVAPELFAGKRLTFKYRDEAGRIRFSKVTLTRDRRFADVTHEFSGDK
jgi:hypothetical protein